MEHYVIGYTTSERATLALRMQGLFPEYYRRFEAAVIPGDTLPILRAFDEVSKDGCTHYTPTIVRVQWDDVEFPPDEWFFKQIREGNIAISQSAEMSPEFVEI